MAGFELRTALPTEPQPLPYLEFAYANNNNGIQQGIVILEKWQKCVVAAAESFSV